MIEDIRYFHVFIFFRVPSATMCYHFELKNFAPLSFLLVKKSFFAHFTGKAALSYLKIDNIIIRMRLNTRKIQLRRAQNSELIQYEYITI